MSNSIVAMTADDGGACDKSEEGVRGPDWSRVDGLVGVDRAEVDEAPKGALG
jgi:hypothetical protein